MSVDLQSVDLIRERIDASYDEALDALKKSDGDVLEALALLEKMRREDEDVFASTVELITDVEELARDWEVTDIKVRYGGKILADIPVSLVSAGAIAAALLATFISRCTIDIEKRHRRGPEAAADNPVEADEE